MKTYHGSCVCGAIRFSCDLDLGAGTTRCNCSFCKKARFWMAFAPSETFHLHAGADQLADYQRTPPGRDEPFLHFYFCRVCGVRAFTQSAGEAPGLGRFHAINIACLDDVPEAELDALPVRTADGAHERWHETPAYHRYL